MAIGVTPEAGTATSLVDAVAEMVTPSMLEDFREWRKNAKPEDREALEQWIAALIASLRQIRSAIGRGSSAMPTNPDAPVPNAPEARYMRLVDLLENYRPGGYDEPWSWDDMERNIRTRQCLCCGLPGHYQETIEALIRECGLTEGVYLGDGVVKDGHHRIIAARTLEIDLIPLESGEANSARWMRDHGPVDWQHRKFGDR